MPLDGCQSPNQEVLKNRLEDKEKGREFGLVIVFNSLPWGQLYS